MPSSSSRFGSVGQPVAAPADDTGADAHLLRRLARVERQIHMPVSFALALTPEPGASFRARQAIRKHLGDALPVATLADLTLVVSELVGNALSHGPREIELRLEVDGISVKGDVIGAGRGAGNPGPPDDDAARLALFIVARIAESWGVHEGTEHVWFVMPVGEGDPELGECDVDQPGTVLPADA